MRRSSDKVALGCAAVCILCVAVTAFVIAPAVLETSKLSKANARLVRENAARTRETAALARAIQRQRKDSIRSSCRALNRRHRNTIKALDTLIARMPPGPRRARAIANREGTEFLLNAIVPRQNCKQLVRRSAPTPHP